MQNDDRTPEQSGDDADTTPEAERADASEASAAATPADTPEPAAPTGPTTPLPQAAAPAAAATATAEPEPEPTTPWYRRLWFLITAGAVAALLLFGAGFATGAATTGILGVRAVVGVDRPLDREFPGGPGERPDRGEWNGQEGSGSTGTDS